MKTYGKRLLSLLLCCVLLLGLLPAAVFADGEPDTTAPVLTAGAVNRTSDTAATVKFTSDEAGNYYYTVVDAGAEAPTIDTTVEGTPCDTSEQTISLTLTAGAKDVYIVVKDAAENVSLPLKIAVPVFAVNLYAAFAALTETTTLPASFDYTLGSEPLYSAGADTGYAKLLKVEIAEADVGKALNIAFTSKTGTSPFPISVLDDISGTADPVAFGVGTVSYSLTKAGTYYIVLAGPGGECHAELSLTTPPTVLTAGFKALTETTTLPASFDYTLGSEDLYSYTIGGNTFYAKLLKINVTEDYSRLVASFTGKDADLNTGIMLFFQDGDNIRQVGGASKNLSTILANAGTYYIALAGYNATVTGECHAELSLTPSAVIPMVDGFKALTETATLPASFDYTLGSENTLYTHTITYDDGYEDTYTVSAKLMKVEVEAASTLRVSFAGVEKDVDTTLWLFSESDGVFTLIDHVDNDSLNGYGESTQFTLEDAGTYYLALASHCDSENGPCHAEISLTTPPKTIPMVDGFKALTETTTLPASFDYTLGSENTLYTHTITYDDGYEDTYTVSAKLMKVELEANSFLRVSFAGAEKNVDTTLWLFSESDGVFTLIKHVDNDSLNGNGESTLFTLEDAGTYYLALASHCDSENGPCHAEVSVVSYMGSLDFTADPVPVPAEGDKWSWDPETKTLTLKDGFSIYCKDDDAIILPDGSVVVVEGEAAIISGYDDGIEGGDLTIRGGAGSRLTISADDDGIYCDGDVLIEDCTLNIQSSYNGVYAYGSITVRRSVLNIDSGDECLESDYSGKGVTIEDSTLRLVSGEEGIETYGGDITITDSDVNIDTTSDEEGIYTSGNGNITVTGGRLVIAACEEALEGNKVTLSNVVFDLRTVDDEYDLLDMDSPDGFSLPGTFRLYDFAGNLLYEGEWKDELLNGDTLYVDNTQVFHAVSVQEHTWSEDWTTDDTHHWHECTDPYCMLTENADKDGYGEHEGELKNAKPATATEDGYTGDTVCKVCGKKLAAGQVIPATGEQPTNPSEPVNPNNPGTGDGSHLLLWIALLLTSCVGIVVTTVSVRKRIVK